MYSYLYIIYNNIRTNSPNASTSNPRKIVSPPLRSSNFKSAPMNANSTGCRTTQAHSKTFTTASSWSSPASLSAEITGCLRFRVFDLLLQPVPATNADMMHARGPAPGYPKYELPVTAKNPPAPSRNDLFAVVDRSIYNNCIVNKINLSVNRRKKTFSIKILYSYLRIDEGWNLMSQ